LQTESNSDSSGANSQSSYCDLNEHSFNDSREKSAPIKCKSLKISVATQCDIPRRRRLRKSDSRWTPEQKAAEIKEWNDALESFKAFTEKRMSKSQLSNGSSKFYCTIIS